MSFDLNVSTNFAQVAKQLKQFQTKSLPKAISKAEQRTTEFAQRRAKVAMQKQLDKPTTQVVNSVRRQFRSAAQVKANTGESKVFVAPWAVDILWHNTFTENPVRRKLEKRNPDAGKRGVLMPTKRLRNPRGNLRGFRTGKLKDIRASKKYFEVSIGAKIKGKHGNLKPGIYEVQQLKRSRKIRMVVAYAEDRYVTPKWKLRQVVNDAYAERLPIELDGALSEEIRKLFR